MSGPPLGQCHLCGRRLMLHAYSIVGGCQYEEYYCRHCGQFSQGAFPIREDMPEWVSLYQRRQALIRQGPAHGRRQRRTDRIRGAALRDWIDEVHGLGLRLVALDGEAPPASIRQVERRS